jgi:undecaprenyl diphosphate synthase
MRRSSARKKRSWRSETAVTPASPTDEPFFTSDRATELLPSLDAEAVPAHVAIIMDGNGRWAANRSLPRLAGHKEGARAVRETIGTAIELGLDYLTIYSFSSENWSRPADEVRGLMDLFVEVLERELDNLQRRSVRVIVSGRMPDLPKKTRAAFDRTMENTAHNTGLTLVVALNYGGRDEILDACRALVEEAADGSLSPGDIDAETFAAHLYTPGVPDPDLVIRTSGEMRVSNFLLWQIAYSELYVTDVLWPDFDRDDLLAAVIDYQSRARRFGGS